MMGVEHLLAPGAGLEKLGEGFGFTEGPVWLHSEGALIFSDIVGNSRWRFSDRDGVVLIRAPNSKGNGMASDGQGRIYVCEHETSTLVREEPDGSRRPIASHFGGKELNSPNDVVISGDGFAYFTDPGYGRRPVFGLERDQALSFQGVYRVPIEGGDLELLVDDFEQPNGLCFSPDGSVLYVNDSEACLVKAFDVLPGGSLGGGRLVHDGMFDPSGEDGGVPDGMKCDSDGRIYVTGPGGVWVLDPDGSRIGVIEVPEVVGNLAWGGDDHRTLYLAASTSLYRIALDVAGAPVP